MKVLHILHELKFSGAEIMYVDAAPVFQKLGCELSVVATAANLGEYATEFKKAGYTVYHKPYPARTRLFQRILFWRKFIKFLKTENIDVVHNHSSGTFWGISLCSKLAGRKSIHTFHNVFPTNWYSRYYHILLRWTAKNLFLCKFQTISDSVYQNELKQFKNKSTKIYNWYGSNRFFPGDLKEKQKLRNELKIPENALILISIGGCSPIKRHHDIIRSIPKLKESIPNCIYLHLGSGDTEMEEKKLAKELGVESHVRFLGNQKEVRKYLIASDIYLMPSKHEGIPITTIEAMACKIPAILYDVPGLRDFNKNGQNSLLIPEDHKLLAEKISQFANDSLLRERLTENAYRLVTLNFDMKMNAKKIFDLYKS